MASYLALNEDTKRTFLESHPRKPFKHTYIAYKANYVIFIQKIFVHNTKGFAMIDIALID